MTRVQLVHWNESEAAVRITQLEAAGFEVLFNDLSHGGFRRIRNDLPDAIVVELSRLPSHGCAVAFAIRQSKFTRHIPMVFVDGETVKVARINEALPDATYTTWKSIKSALNKAISNPVKVPVVPKSDSGSHSGTPLSKKLGLKPDTITLLVNAPAGFEKQLDPLPSNATLRRGKKGSAKLTVWFVQSLKQLESQIDTFADAIGEGGLWIAWPKLASGFKTDVTN